VVNGPGEAREADVGIAGGKKVGVLFKKGQLVRKVPEKDLLAVLLKEVEALSGEKAG
jgi:(E)-4-hydroxy-3-methylbut-2-enyl-diphosphate synthase